MGPWRLVLHVDKLPEDKTMLRTFHLDCGIDIRESAEPNTVFLRFGDQEIPCSRKQLQELADLLTYSTYGNSINWAEEPDND